MKFESANHFWRSPDTHEAYGSFVPVWARINILPRPQTLIKRQMSGVRQRTFIKLADFISLRLQPLALMLMLFHPFCSNHAKHPGFWQACTNWYCAARITVHENDNKRKIITRFSSKLVWPTNRTLHFVWSVIWLCLTLSATWRRRSGSVIARFRLTQFFPPSTLVV